MKQPARIAYLFILLFFLFFNGLQIYLISERIAESKNKFGFACADALLFSLTEYSKLKSIDSASLPRNVLVAYSSGKIAINHRDTQTVTLSTSSFPVSTDTVDASFAETMLNSRGFKTIDLILFDSLYQGSLLAKNIHAGYRLDTINVPVKRSGRSMVQESWERKKRAEYYFSVRPARLPYNSNVFVFAEVKRDAAFFKNDLLWPLLSSALILLIGNTALVFVYRTIRKQKRINEVKTDFINNITHEMKTPITIAAAGLDALDHHVPHTERTSFYLHTSKKQLHVLNDFVERILDAAVRDISDFNLTKERMDLHALLEELLQSRSVLTGKPVNLVLSGRGPVYINGDRLHLQTAFHNMIDNAIKYSNESVDIHIDIAEHGHDCTVSIRDNGKGIPPQYTKNVFEKFFRVPQGDAQSIKGFGLGLYYVNTIVKKHSGNITVHSKLQSGTEFIITLPLSVEG